MITYLYTLHKSIICGLVNFILSKFNSKRHMVGRAFSCTVVNLPHPSQVEVTVLTLRPLHCCLPTSDSRQGHSPDSAGLRREELWQENFNTCSLSLFYLYIFFSHFYFHDCSLIWVDGILQTTLHPPLVNPGWIKLIPLLHDWVWICFRPFSDNSSPALQMSSLNHEFLSILCLALWLRI